MARSHMKFLYSKRLLYLKAVDYTPSPAASDRRRRQLQRIPHARQVRPARAGKVTAVRERQDGGIGAASSQLRRDGGVPPILVGPPLHEATATAPTDAEAVSRANIAVRDGHARFFAAAVAATATTAAAAARASARSRIARQWRRFPVLPDPRPPGAEQ